MALFKKLGKAVKKAVGGGAVASSQRMAPAMGGAVTAAPKKMQPALGGVAAAKVAQPMAAQAAAMPRKAPLSNLRSSVKSMAANVKTAVAKKPALQKAVASQANKPVGRLVGGLSSKFLKRR
jgi:hypothetical protein